MASRRRDVAPAKRSRKAPPAPTRSPWPTRREPTPQAVAERRAREAAEREAERARYAEMAALLDARSEPFAGPIAAIDFSATGLRWRAKDPGDPRSVIEVLTGEAVVAVFAENAWPLARALCEVPEEAESHEVALEEAEVEARKESEEERDREERRRCAAENKASAAVSRMTTRDENLREAVDAALADLPKDAAVRVRVETAFAEATATPVASCDVGDCERVVAVVDRYGCKDFVSDWCAEHQEPCETCEPDDTWNQCEHDKRRPTHDEHERRGK